MKKETFKKENDVAVASTDPELPEDIIGDGKEGDTDSTEGDDDESGRPNRGAGSAGPKNPIGGGNRGQYSLRNNNDE